MIAQTYNNYWKLDLKELPTMGKLYPEGTVIKIRPLNVQEIKYLATICEENATDIINEILEKCVLLKNIEFEDIFLGLQLGTTPVIGLYNQHKTNRL